MNDLSWYSAIGCKEILAGAVAPTISNLSHESGAVREGAQRTITFLIEAGLSPDSFERAVLPTAADLRNPSRALRESAQSTARILAAKKIAPLLLTEAIIPSVDNLIVPHWYDIGELRLLVSYAGWTLKTMLELEIGYEVFAECIPRLVGLLTSNGGGYTSTPSADVLVNIARRGIGSELWEQVVPHLIELLGSSLEPFLFLQGTGERANAQRVLTACAQGGVGLVALRQAVQPSLDNIQIGHEAGRAALATLEALVERGVGHDAIAAALLDPARARGT